MNSVCLNDAKIREKFPEKNQILKTIISYYTANQLKDIMKNKSNFLSLDGNIEFKLDEKTYILVNGEDFSSK